MPPRRTRRSNPIDPKGQITDSIGVNNSPLPTSMGTNTASQPHVASQRAATGQGNNLKKSNKRTLSLDANVSTNPTIQSIDQVPPQKKTRNTRSSGTADDGEVQQQGQRASVAKVNSTGGNRIAVNTLLSSSSFYHDRTDKPFSLRPLEPSGGNSDGSDEEDILESEYDWLDDQQMSQKECSKFSDRTVLERASWGGSANIAGCSSVDPMEQVDTSLGDGVTDDTHDAPAPSSRKWPIETDIIFAKGSNKVTLTAQDSVIQDVIQDAINNLRISLLFENAFPTAVALPAIIEQSLFTASDHSGAHTVRERLIYDKQYRLKMMRLPRARVSLIRSEVKERVNAIILAAFTSVTRDTVSETVGRLLLNYNYIFPKGGHVTRKQPYRNEWIILAIQQHFFSGGSVSFANECEHIFPTSKDRNGVTVREVPVAMVALVATAVYATLHEWRSGERRAVEFSANTFLDPYHGHVGSLNHIQEERNRTFHAIMADIYSRASGDIKIDTPNVSIVNLDLDALED